MKNNKKSNMAEPMKIKGIEVNVKYPNNPTREQKDKALERALRKFKRIVKDSGLMLEIYSRQEFKKPSAVKKEKKIKSLIRMRAINKINNR